MSLEDDLFAQRLRRTADIEALGFRAYGHRFDFTHTIPGILADYSAKTAEELADKPRVQIAGRIQTVRRMGKAGWLAPDAIGRSAASVRPKRRGFRAARTALTSCSTWATSWVWTDIYLARVPANSSVHAEKLTFLSKILLGLPEKWYGLEDVEIRISASATWI